MDGFSTSAQSFETVLVRKAYEQYLTRIACVLEGIASRTVQYMGVALENENDALASWLEDELNHVRTAYKMCRSSWRSFFKGPPGV